MNKDGVKGEEPRMTTPKRCEVCGHHPLSKILCDHKCHSSDTQEVDSPVCDTCGKGLVEPCSCPPPPRPDEWEKPFKKLLVDTFSMYADDETFKRWNDGVSYPTVPVEAITHQVRSLLLSYSKEREKEMWLKCREAVEKVKGEALKLPMGADGGWNQVSHGLLKSLSALDSVNPER